MNWICSTCGKEFPSRAKMLDHRVITGEAKISSISKVCPLCGESFTNKRRHSKTCKGRFRGPRHWTEEEKKHLSEKRKEYLRSHPDEHPWKRSSKFKSVPCEKLKDDLRKYGIPFLEEQGLSNIEENYSIDIVIPGIRLGIEINGNQHYDTKTGKLKPYYQKRHDVIEAAGTKLLEIHYTKVYDKGFVIQLCNQLIDRIPSKQLYEKLHSFEDCQPYFDIKAKREAKREILKQKRLLEIENARKKGLVDSIGRLNATLIPIDDLEKRKCLILESGVDLKKFGWVSKVSEKTGLSKHQIENIVSYFNLDVFRRKLPAKS